MSTTPCTISDSIFDEIKGDKNLENQKCDKLVEYYNHILACMSHLSSKLQSYRDCSDKLRQHIISKKEVNISDDDADDELISQPQVKKSTVTSAKSNDEDDNDSIENLQQVAKPKISTKSSTKPVAKHASKSVTKTQAKSDDDTESVKDVPVKPVRKSAKKVEKEVDDDEKKPVPVKQPSKPIKKIEKVEKENGNVSEKKVTKQAAKPTVKRVVKKTVAEQMEEIEEPDEELEIEQEVKKKVAAKPRVSTKKTAKKEVDKDDVRKN